MNRARIKGKQIEDRDYIIIDKNDHGLTTGDVVLAVIDNKATVKRYIDDRANGQIVLMAESSLDFAPIYLHEDDDFSISGKAVGVVKRPQV